MLIFYHSAMPDTSPPDAQQRLQIPQHGAGDEWRLRQSQF